MVRPEELGVLLSSHPLWPVSRRPPTTGHSGPGNPVGRVENILLKDC
jgi:hypothetical protein